MLSKTGPSGNWSAKKNPNVAIMDSTEETMVIYSKVFRIFLYGIVLSVLVHNTFLSAKHGEQIKVIMHEKFSLVFNYLMYEVFIQVWVHASV